MKRLEDKVAIITGGADGIGKATAELFAAEGAKVAIWDLNTEKGEALVKQLKAHGYEATFIRVNTSDMTAVEKAADIVMEEYGRIDILLNNAGITRDASMKKMTTDQWQQVIDVNLSGVFYCTKAVYPFMLEQGYGRIISTSSVVALYGNFGQTNYVAAIPNRFLNPGKTSKVAQVGKERLPNSKLVMIPKAGHFVQFEKSGEVNNAIKAFLL